MERYFNMKEARKQRIQKKVSQKRIEVHFRQRVLSVLYEVKVERQDDITAVYDEKLWPERKGKDKETNNGRGRMLNCIRKLNQWYMTRKLEKLYNAEYKKKKTRRENVRT